RSFRLYVDGGRDLSDPRRKLRVSDGRRRAIPGRARSDAALAPASFAGSSGTRHSSRADRLKRRNGASCPVRGSATGTAPLMKPAGLGGPTMTDIQKLI